MRLHVEYTHTLDPDEWQRKYAAGLVPNRLPYGIDRLAQHGFELDVLAASDSFPLQRVLGGAARRLSGGFEIVDSVRDWRRRQCDVALCWCERTGVPAALRSRLPGEPAAAMGTLWMTDPASDLGAVNARVARTAARQAAVVWANSRAQLDVLASMGVSRDRLHLLHTPGIDVDFWRAERDEPEPDLVLSAGNDRHRDHGFLVAAMRRIREERSGARLELVTREPLDLGELGERHASVPHAGLRTLYGRASVVAVALKPNLHISGATVILEAMSCERPVVVNRSPGYDEYVEHGVTGLLVPTGDVEAFAAAVRELLADPDRARDMGRAGRLAVEREFSSERTMAKLADIVRSARV